MNLNEEINRQKKLMNIDNEKLIKARELGKQAFLAGKNLIPAQDAEFMNLLAGVPAGEGLPYLKAWSDAWTQANLAAPW